MDWSGSGKDGIEKGFSGDPMEVNNLPIPQDHPRFKVSLISKEPQFLTLEGWKYVRDLRGLDFLTCQIVAFNHFTDLASKWLNHGNDEKRAQSSGTISEDRSDPAPPKDSN